MPKYFTKITSIKQILQIITKSVSTSTLFVLPVTFSFFFRILFLKWFNMNFINFCNFLISLYYFDLIILLLYISLGNDASTPGKFSSQTMLSNFLRRAREMQFTGSYYLLINRVRFFSQLCDLQVSIFSAFPMSGLNVT